jgi:hypothetical protein
MVHGLYKEEQIRIQQKKKLQYKKGKELKKKMKTITAASQIGGLSMDGTTKYGS